MAEAGDILAGVDSAHSHPEKVGLRKAVSLASSFWELMGRLKVPRRGIRSLNGRKEQVPHAQRLATTSSAPHPPSAEPVVTDVSPAPDPPAKDN